MSRTAWRRVAVVLASVAAAKAVLVVLDSTHVVKAETPLDIVLLGLIIGLTYGVLAVGLVLIYRTNGIINFAHGQIGAFGAAFFGLAAVNWGIPYWLSFVLATALSALVAVAAETGVVRRLQKAPRLMSIVATLGVGQFLSTFAVVLNASSSVGSRYPQPDFMPVFTVGALRVTSAYSGMLILSPVIVVALAVFLRTSRFGLGILAAAANPEAARMSGIYSSRMSSLAWALAGALSCFTAVLTAPTQPALSADSFGPSLLLRAMTAAVIARMESLPIALGAGVGLGVVEQFLRWNYPVAGIVEMAMFAIILIALLGQRQRGGREEEKSSWAAVQAMRPVPAALRTVWAVRHLGTVAGVALLIAAAALPLVISNRLAVSLTGILCFAMVGLSVGILTGLCGQLTLGQFAVASIGAVISYEVSRRIGDFPLALAYAGIGAGLVCVLVGLPSLRIRGLMLTVTTLSFALALPLGLLSQSWVLGGGRDPGRPIVLDKPLTTGRSYYLFALCVFAVVLLLCRNIRASGFGRLFVAVRDNEDNARAFGIRVQAVKVQAYLISGVVAGVGGATYAHSLSSIDSTTFPAGSSIDVVVMAVIGGVSVLVGPILGAVFVQGLPLLPLDSLGIAATKLGALLLILWRPSGIVSLLEPLRDGVVRVLARGVSAEPEDEPVDAEPDDLQQAASRTAAIVQLRQPEPVVLVDDAPLLVASDLRKSFGGVHAVRGVSFEVRRGETLGLIGPNGAGKTTTFELLSGFTKPDEGRVLFQGRDVTRSGPESRAERGLIRSFQDAALFPTMTASETIMLAFERLEPTRVAPSLVGWTRSERDKALGARELISFMSLERYQDKQIRELSTGTRRIVELACLIALRPTCLLLDEPSSGIAQRETEALGQVLLDLKAQLGLTLVVIEHDIPLIMGISDRIVAMADGTVIAAGAPQDVRDDPTVIDAYLGGSVTAIERSGVVLERA